MPFYSNTIGASMSALDNSESTATVHLLLSSDIYSMMSDDCIKFLLMQSALHNVCYFSIKMQLSHCYQVWHMLHSCQPLASPAIGHWGMCPPRLPTV